MAARPFGAATDVPCKAGGGTTFQRMLATSWGCWFGSTGGIFWSTLWERFSPTLLTPASPSRGGAKPLKARKFDGGDWFRAFVFSHNVLCVCTSVRD